MKDAKNQLKEALLQKCQSQVRIGELNSREVELQVSETEKSNTLKLSIIGSFVVFQYRENKWQQEKQLLRTECDWYGEELQKKEQQILTSRQELVSL